MNGKLLTLVGLSLFCAAAITAKASAPHTLNFQSVTVSYSRADLAQPEGVAALYVRLEQAAKTVCHERGVRDWMVYPPFRRCYERAIDGAVELVNSPELTALRRSKTQQRDVTRR